MPNTSPSKVLNRGAVSENAVAENRLAYNVAGESDFQAAGVSALKVVLNILEKWQCTADQSQAILRLPKATFYRYKKNPENASITGDLLERLSYLLNIHATLRTVFSNPENVYGFMSMSNDNAYFDGRSPIQVLENGSFAAIYEVSKRIDALKGAGW